MKPVMQTFFRDEHGEPGNCVQASVASLLELPLEAVPHFFAGKDETNYHEGWVMFTDWFEALGIYPREIQVKDEGHGPHPAWTWHHLASGKSPRGIDHMVIRSGFDIVHDPHPDGGGVELENVTELHVFDPTKLHKLQELRRHAGGQVFYLEAMVARELQLLDYGPTELQSKWRDNPPRLPDGDQKDWLHEATYAVLDALVHEGVPAWDGDAVSCVTQIILAYAKRERVVADLLTRRTGE